MNIWIVTYSNPIYQDEYYTGEIVLEKAFLTFLNGEIECAHLSIIARVLPAKIVVKMNSPNEKFL